MIGAAIFVAVALGLTVVSFVWPPAPACTAARALTVPTGTPDPAHGGKTIALRAKELLSAFPEWRVGDPPRLAAKERWLGVWCLFTVETHPPDAGIAFAHKGVTVTECKP